MFDTTVLVLRSGKEQGKFHLLGTIRPDLTVEATLILPEGCSDKVREAICKFISFQFYEKAGEDE